MASGRGHVPVTARPRAVSFYGLEAYQDRWGVIHARETNASSRPGPWICTLADAPAYADPMVWPTYANPRAWTFLVTCLRCVARLVRA